VTQFPVILLNDLFFPFRSDVITSRSLGPSALAYVDAANWRPIDVAENLGVSSLHGVYIHARE